MQVSYVMSSTVQLSFQQSYEREVMQDSDFIVQLQGYVYPLGATSVIDVYIAAVNAGASLYVSTNDSVAAQVWMNTHL